MLPCIPLRHPCGLLFCIRPRLYGGEGACRRRGLCAVDSRAALTHHPPPPHTHTHPSQLAKARRQLTEYLARYQEVMHPGNAKHCRVLLDLVTRLQDYVSPPSPVQAPHTSHSVHGSHAAAGRSPPRAAAAPAPSAPPPPPLPPDAMLSVAALLINVGAVAVSLQGLVAFMEETHLVAKLRGMDSGGGGGEGHPLHSDDAGSLGGVDAGGIEAGALPRRGGGVISGIGGAKPALPGRRRGGSGRGGGTCMRPPC